MNEERDFIGEVIAEDNEARRMRTLSEMSPVERLAHARGEPTPPVTVINGLTAEVARLTAELERLKNLPHGQILAESAARHLLNSGAQNFIGDVFTIEADDGETKFEIVVTTQKVGAKSPGEVCNELQTKLGATQRALRQLFDLVTLDEYPAGWTSKLECGVLEALDD